MKILNRYIAKQVMSATGLVLLVLIGIDSFMLFFNEIGDVGKGSYTIEKAFLYVTMQLPFNLYQLFPMAGFLGCLIGLGRMATSSELVVMRASGFSIFDITTAVIRAAIFILIIVTLVGEGISPHLQSYSEHMKAVSLEKKKNYNVLGGVWLRDRDQFIHIGEVSSSERVENISVWDIKDHRLQKSTFAPYALLQADGVWQMREGKQTLFTPEKVTSRALPRMNLAIKFDPVVLALGQKSVDQLSIKSLYQSIEYRHKVGLDIEQYQFTFWARLFQPVATIIMICLGIPFIFGSLRSATMGLRIITGIIVGFAFYTLNQFTGPMAVVYQLSPVAAASIPIVIFLSACVILFRRTQ